MDCGIPFCHQGCPLGNLIPEWNDLVYRGRCRRGARAPARDEQLPRGHRPRVPRAVRGVVRAQHRRRAGDHQGRRARRSSTRVRREGSIAPQLAARADRQARRGRRLRPCRASRRRSSSPAPATTSTVFERDDRIGGLLRYGIPDFKMEKADHRSPHRADARRGRRLPRRRRRRHRRPRRRSSSHDFDAVVLRWARARRATRRSPVASSAACTSRWSSSSQQNRRVAGDAPMLARRSSPTGKHVVVIGGGDTGSDCVGTSIRQGAASVTQLELMPKPALVRLPTTRGPSGRSSSARRAPRKRAPSATGRSRRAASAARAARDGPRDRAGRHRGRRR